MLRDASAECNQAQPAKMILKDTAAVLQKNDRSARSWKALAGFLQNTARNDQILLQDLSFCMGGKSISYIYKPMQLQLKSL